MDLYINNVGIVSDSNIKLNGLTVITGENNSGKSTVGKALSSVISAVKNIDEVALNDKINYSIKNLEKVFEDLFLYVFIKYDKFSDKFVHEYPILFNSFRRQDISVYNINDLKIHINKYIKELYRFEINVSKDKDMIKLFSHLNENYNLKIKNAIISLEKVLKLLDEDQTLEKYAKQKISDALNIEFSDQIAPVRYLDRESSFKIIDNNNTIFDINISDKKISNKLIWKRNNWDCFYINDINVLDELSNYKNKNRKELREYRGAYNLDIFENFIMPNKKYNHKDKLLEALLEEVSTFESQVLEEEYKDFIAKIDRAFSEEIVYLDGEFVCKSNKLNLKNLATGSKMFAILRLLLKKGKLNSNTILVLDEPENHLHPEWQLLLADFITKLIKEKEIKVLVTTHSPTFVFALETMSKKYKMEDIANYYQSLRKEDKYLVSLKEVSGDDISNIHYHLNKPYFDIDDLKNEISEEK